MAVKISLLLFSLAIILHDANCICPCTRYYSHSQEAFCDPDADFAMRVTIKQKIDLGNRYKFKVMKKEYKKTAAYQALTMQQRRHLYMEKGACEANLVVGDTYALTGEISNNKLWVSSCYWVKRWSDLIAYERKNFRKNYKENCACQFAAVGGVRPPHPFPPTACVLIATYIYPCGKYAYCACAQPACTSCSLIAKEPKYSDCTDKQPLPP